MKKKAVIGGVAAAAVVVGAGGWWAVDATIADELTQRGTCGGASWTLDADREDGGTEVSAELRSSGPGEEWQVDITRDDVPLISGSRTTDEDGEIDVTAFGSGNPGDATYAVIFTPAQGETCTGTLN